MIEREVKYLGTKKLIENFKHMSIEIKQGYLMLEDKGKQLRIRIYEDEEVAFICYKYKISSTEKNEFEYNIPYEDGLELYNSCNYKLEKLRTTIRHGNIESTITTDIDIYSDELAVVEFEYDNEDLLNKHIKVFKKLDYITEEITDKKEYSNITLAKINKKE